MANTIRIKRRAAGGAAGAPASLAAAELAFNEQDNILYYGKGDSGGVATSILAIGGTGKVWGVDNGGTGLTSAALGSLMYGQGTTTLGALAGNTTTTRMFLNQTGNGSISAAPVWAALIAADIPTITSAKISDFDTQVRTSRLDQMATPTASVSMGSQRITNLLDPSSAQDAATKNYVDGLVSGSLDVKSSCRVATAAALPAYTRTGNVITASANGALAAVDGVTLVLNDRLLLKNGAAGADNGIYYVSQVGDGGTPFTLTRATDADTSAEVTSGMFTFVVDGTVNASSGWVLTTLDTITLNTTALTFAQFSGAGQITAGAGMTKTGNTLDVVGTTNRITVAADSIDIAATYVGQTSITTLGTIGTGTWQGTAVGAAYGGTGQTTYTTGDLLQASGATTLSKLAAVATGNVLISGGVGTVSSWGKVDLTTHVSGILPGANGGTGNGFTAFTGPTTSLKTFTLPNASATILTDNAVVTVAQGGTGRNTSTTAYGLIAAGTTATGAHQTLAAGATTEILVGGGASALPVWTTATGSGAPVRATSPTLVTPVLGVATATSINGNTFTTGTYTLTGTAGKTLTFSNSLTLAGTDGTTMTFPAASTTVAGLGTTQTFTGINTFTPAARSSGAASYFTLTTPADTNQTASTEAIGASFTAATRQWATGTLTLQRERVFAAPTYGFVGASALTTAINVDIADPVQGTNATITNRYALRVGTMLATGIIWAGSTPTQLTDAAGKLLSAAHNTIAVAQGGTGLTGFTTGDLLQASGASTLAALAAVATGNVLLSGGVGTISAWGKVGLTTHVSGILPTANGGTGIAYFTAAGPTTARVYTFPDANATMLSDAMTIDGGTF